MGLTAVEKVAGRRFRTEAQAVLAAALLDFPESVPCSGQIRFFRHECPTVKGRTRAVRLDDMTLLSPEIWVGCGEDAGEAQAFTPVEAAQRLEAGMVAEYEQVLAGKFSFTWKAGKCGHCGMMVTSREGVLKDVRLAPKIRQDNLSDPVGNPGGIEALKREVDYGEMDDVS